jgi:hypothetical protein
MVSSKLTGKFATLLNICVSGAGLRVGRSKI